MTDNVRPLHADHDDAAFDPEIPRRRIRLTPASEIEMRPVLWMWEQRVSLGSLALLAGPPGAGKSTLAYWVAARVTRGRLPGEFYGQPRSVLVAASEDSWAHTIVPRLVAAGADLSRVYQIDVETEMGEGEITLPSDLYAVEELARENEVALMLLDPLMSRISGKVDTHKDAEVRTVLEPIVKLADRARMSVIGLIHHNKSGGSDAGNLVMGSIAFRAVARSVLTVIKDPEDETGDRRLFGTTKNNLGREDMPTMAYVIKGHHVADSDEGPIWTGKLEWVGEVEGTIGDAVQRSSKGLDDRSALGEAVHWLGEYLMKSDGGEAKRADIVRAGGKEGISESTLKRACERLKLVRTVIGFPPTGYWRLPEVTAETIEATSGPSLNPGLDGPNLDHHPDHALPYRPNKFNKIQAGGPPRARAEWVPTDEDAPPEDHDEPRMCRVCDLELDPTIAGSVHPVCDPGGAW